MDVNAQPHFDEWHFQEGREIHTTSVTNTHDMRDKFTDISCQSEASHETLVHNKRKLGKLAFPQNKSDFVLHPKLLFKVPSH